MRTGICAMVVGMLLFACQTTPTVSGVGYRVYLPMIQDDMRSHRIGVENEGSEWMRLAPYYRGDFLKISAHWAMVERDGWGYVDRKLAGFDGPLFLSLKGAPGWMTMGATCEPLPEYYWPAFADWASEAVERYHPSWVELQNEPDTTATWAEYYFGCWGEGAEAGRYYGRFAAYVADALSRLHPEVEIIAGALMNTTNDFTVGFLSVPSSVRVISFHVYEWCGKPYAYPMYLARLRASTSKPVYLSETSLIYSLASANCEVEQAEYFGELAEIDVPMAVWYTLGCNAWQNSDMLDCGSVVREKPVYWAYEEVMR